MIDLTDKQLSDAMFEIAKEINRGCWLADRAGISTEMVAEVQVQAVVTVRPGETIVEKISISATGEVVQTASESGTQTQTASESGTQTQSATESGTQTQSGSVGTAQSGGDSHETVTNYKNTEDGSPL